MNAKKGSPNDKNNQQNPAASKLARLQDAGEGVEASWEEVDGRLIKAAIVAAAREHCACIFGVTSDGGALSFTLLNSGAPIKKWPKSAASAESLLHEIIATLES